MSVAAKDPPKITIAAWVSTNIRRSPPIKIRVTRTMAPATRPRPVEISIWTTPDETANGRRPDAAKASLARPHLRESYRKTLLEQQLVVPSRTQQTMRLKNPQTAALLARGRGEPRGHRTPRARR